MGNTMLSTSEAMSSIYTQLSGTDKGVLPLVEACNLILDYILKNGFGSSTNNPLTPAQLEKIKEDVINKVKTQVPLGVLLKDCELNNSKIKFTLSDNSIKELDLTSLITDTVRDYVNTHKTELKGQKGDKGEQGQRGIQGKSAYDVWLEKGNVGTEVDFLNSLKGQKGDTGFQGLQGNNGTSLDYEWQGTKLGIKKSSENSYSYVDLKGSQGVQGSQGTKGDKGVGIKDVSINGNNLSIKLDDESTKVITLPILKGEQGLNGNNGVGITNITQQDKKLIVDLSNNTRKEFTIPSSELPSGEDLLNKINNDVQKTTQSFKEFKNKLEIPSPAEISTYFMFKGIVDVDLNTLTKDTDVGYYYIAEGATNKPTESDFALMFVYKNMLYVMQIYVIDSQRIYIRASEDDGLNWNDWEKISSGNNDNNNLRIKFNSNNSATFLSDNSNFWFNPEFIEGNTLITDFSFGRGNTSEYANIYAQNVNAKGKLIAQDEIISSGDITAFSDIRLKTNIEKIENALDKVCQLSGYTYDMNNKRSTGVIAQEVEKVLPEVVQDREDGYKTVAYGNMIGLLIEAIKELKEEIKVIKNGD